MIGRTAQERLRGSTAVWLLCNDPAAVNIGGWEIDLQALYGSAWPDRQRWHQREWLWEVPREDLAVLFFAIGEIGLNKQVGKLAVFRKKAAPELRFTLGRHLFWFEGLDDDPVRHDEARGLLFVSEYDWRRFPGRVLGVKKRVIELERGRLVPVEEARGLLSLADDREGALSNSEDDSD